MHFFLCLSTISRWRDVNCVASTSWKSPLRRLEIFGMSLRTILCDRYATFILTFASSVHATASSVMSRLSVTVTAYVSIWKQSISNTGTQRLAANMVSVQILVSESSFMSHERIWTRLSARISRSIPF
ncbi:hypothetical protein CPC08DRAFT_189056 [Agrocybe pediades]|nr:hypothetical protein CPC08DRAFT_189056 [Agrocybe pediades]